MMPSEAMLAELLHRTPLHLELGAGAAAERKRAQGRVTIDVRPLPGVDVVWDLNDGLRFLPDACVDAIYTNNVLEHIRELTGLMDEVHRVLKPGGTLEVFVPHFSNPYYYSDPTHERFFGLYTFYYWADDQSAIHRKVPAFYGQKKFRVDRLRLRFATPFGKLQPVYRLVNWAVNLHMALREIYEHSFCHVFPCYGIEATLTRSRSSQGWGSVPRTWMSEGIHGEVSKTSDIWGERYADVGAGYGTDYTFERQVDLRLLRRARTCLPERGIALDVGSFYPATPVDVAGWGWSVVCTDVSRAVCRGIAQIRDRSPLRLHVVQCDGAALPFRPSAFDLVTDLATAVVARRPEEMIREETRVTRRGGVVLLVTNNRWTQSATKEETKQPPGGGCIRVGGGSTRCRPSRSTQWQPNMVCASWRSTASCIAGGSVAGGATLLHAWCQAFAEFSVGGWVLSTRFAEV